MEPTPNLIGVTEQGDPAFDSSWMRWVDQGRPAVLITKDPLRIYLELLWANKRNVIVHTTITGFGGTKIERHVPPLDIALEGYGSLVKMLGADRVVLRVDPIIPTPKGIDTAARVIAMAREIAETRVRISFLDYYKHVQARFAKAGIPPLDYGFHASLDLRKSVWERLGQPEVCGEPDLPSSPCIGPRECEILGVEPMTDAKGQRKACRCLANKLELLTGKVKPCPHGCLYCYWQTAEELKRSKGRSDAA